VENQKLTLHPVVAPVYLLKFQHPTSEMKRKVNLLIVDDHPVFRRGLREIIEENSKFNVIGETSDGGTALRLARELKPDIAIVDIDMPGMNGLETVRAFQKDELPVIVIFLTMYKEEDMFNAAMDLGVKAYIVKDNAADEILAALEKVVANEPFISQSMADMGQRRSNRVQEILLGIPQIDDLTPAERRILKLIAEDHTSKEIADKLKISTKTIENHRQNICHKLKLYGSHSLLKFAFEHKSHL
jgi:DNA-binding NarL/FixJ family response regulator